jgi:hypothetical protein
VVDILQSLITEDQLGHRDFEALGDPEEGVSSLDPVLEGSSGGGCGLNGRSLRGLEDGRLGGRRRGHLGLMDLLQVPVLGQDGVGDGIREGFLGLFPLLFRLLPDLLLVPLTLGEISFSVLRLNFHPDRVGDALHGDFRRLHLGRQTECLSDAQGRSKEGIGRAVRVDSKILEYDQDAHECQGREIVGAKAADLLVHESFPAPR